MAVPRGGPFLLWLAPDLRGEAGSAPALEALLQTASPQTSHSEATDGQGLSSSSADLRGAGQLMPQPQALATGLRVGQGGVDRMGRNRPAQVSEGEGRGFLHWDHSAPFLPPPCIPHHTSLKAAHTPGFCFPLQILQKVSFKPGSE